MDAIDVVVTKQICLIVAATKLFKCCLFHTIVPKRVTPMCQEYQQSILG